MNLNNLSKKTFLIVEAILGISLLLSIFLLPLAVSILIIFLEVNLFLFRDKKQKLFFIFNAIIFGVIITSLYYFEKIGLILMASYLGISILLRVKSDMWFYDDLKKQKV